MESILPVLPTIAKICKPCVPGDKQYRPSRFCFRVPCQEGTLLYHTLTGELLLLPSGESTEQNRDALIRSRFLVPEDLDEGKYVGDLQKIYSLLYRAEQGIKNYLIYTTMDCNARCFYCYEKGRERLPMSEQTARDAAAWICRARAGSPVRLHWFGGEPLYNLRPIEIITAALREKDVPFQSVMTSNAYLFDEALVSAAKKDWNLKSVQITLDGTEEVYNRTKAFIYHGENPYRRVIRNIRLLLDADIHVSIRLNMDAGNWQDLMRLSGELAERFPGREKLQVYAALLFDGTTRRVFESDEECLSRFTALRDTLRALGLSKMAEQKHGFNLSGCMASNDRSINILADGHLGKCEHVTDEFVGSIYDDRLDPDIIASWKEPLRDDACRDCVFFPACGELRRCGKNQNGCTWILRERKRLALEECILKWYNNKKTVPGNGAV